MDDYINDYVLPSDDEKSKKKSSRIVRVLVCIVVLLLIFAVVLCAFLVLRYTQDIDIDDGYDDVTGTYDDSFMYDEDDEDYSENYQTMLVLQSSTNLNDLLADWYSNECELMSSKYVMNFLLIGIDTFSSTSSGNTDVMMLVSVNTKTEQIILTSILRDSYTYYETAYGSVTSKLNAAYSNGGPAYLVQAIEQNYKIEIDYYVAVDFTAFEEVIDLVGGVYCTVEKYEAAAIYAYAGVTTPVGENVLLNGEQALYFCRMRSIYTLGDVTRTENQREVITSLINQASSLSVSELDTLITTLTSYVRTDCSVSKIISLAATALTNKWYEYEIVSETAPSEDARLAYSGSSWIWVVDYPLAAQTVQLSIYGTTDIELSDERVTAFDLVK